MVVGWIALGAAVACLPLVIPLLNVVRTPTWGEDFVWRSAGPVYACLVGGIGALVVLLVLLRDIRRGEVFTRANVARLRLISYCGFAILAACVVGALVSPAWAVFVLLAAVAGFLGLLMRVIKNVIDAARLLKEDADFTI
jgi:hypothetical protein